jgi:hypothetical protein
VRRRLAIDAHVHGVQAQRVALGELHEDREMGIRRVQQLLFELAEFGGDGQSV